VVERDTVYDVAVAEAVHETFTWVWLAAVAETPVGAAGGVQATGAGVTEMQLDGAEAQASLPEGWATTW
jgi:hypothetical protein